MEKTAITTSAALCTVVMFVQSVTAVETASQYQLTNPTVLSKTHAQTNTEKDFMSLIKSALATVKQIQGMEPGTEYTVMVEGKQERGQKELFLYRRTADEIMASGLSSGCGDYATIFYFLMKNKGVDARFISGVELSISSLLYNFSDHTGVAVSNGSRWILVDPTQGKVISQNWDVGSQIYEDKFLIIFSGPREGFPVKGAEQLKQFNANGLKTAPKDVINERINGFDIQIDSSLLAPDGNPSTEAQSFVKKVAELFSEYGISPIKKTPLMIVRGAPHLTMRYDKAGWIVYMDKVVGSYRELNLLSEIDKTDNDLQTLAEANKLVRLNFIVDDSLKNPDGTYVNPNLTNFLTIGEGIYEKFEVSSTRKTTVYLKRGEDNFATYVKPGPDGQWTAYIGTKSAMQISLFLYFEKTIAHK
jgi:hypothetical protein